jgi:hypothetical protein
MKTSTRASWASLGKGSHDDKHGRFFFNDYGITDLSPVEIIGASVDTVRQLFHGMLKQTIVQRFEDWHQDYFHLQLPCNIRDATKFHFTRMGKVSRYRWKLQNNELGIVILLGSYYSKLDTLGQHLKIELSPKFIAQRNSETIMQWLEYINNVLLDDGIAKGCAVHLACDYQNFELPQNFLDLFQTRCRIVRGFDGLNTLDISNVSESVATYGKGQNRNYTIGKPASIQVCAYDKSYEIIKSDKVDYFHQEWSVHSLGVFDKEKTVRRLEMRLSHTVIREIGRGIGVELESFLAVSDYLTDIWRYALKMNRLLMAQGSKLIHPFWQLLMEDVIFSVPAQNIEISRKKKDDVAAIARNVSMLLGNLISICARNAMSSTDVIIFLKRTTVYPQILEVYRQRKMNENDLEEFINEGIRRRLLIGKAA